MPKDFTFEEATEPKEFSFEDAAPEPEPTYPPTYSPRELGPESPTGREESLSPLTFAEWWKATPVRREMEQKFGAGGVPTPKELVDTAFKFASVPPQVAEPYRKITDAYYSALPPAIGGTAAGLRDVALEFPIAAGAVGMGKTMGRLVMGLFTGEYAIAIPEMWQAFKTAKEQGRTREAYQIATKAIAGGLLLGAGGAMEVAGMRGGKVPPVIAKPEAPNPPTIPIPEVPPETAALLPKATAEVAKPEQPAAAPPVWRGTVREVDKPESWGGKKGEKLYIPVDASGKDVEIGGKTILGTTPEEAIDLATRNVKPAAPAAQPETPDASGIQETTEVHGDVRPLAKPASTLPVKEGGERVQPQATGGLPKPEEAARPAQSAVLLTPAVQASGQTFTGTSHAEAIIAAARKGVDATQAEHVFLDAQGNVLNRLDAAKVWEAATGRKVMKPELGLQSEDLRATPPPAGPGEGVPSKTAAASAALPVTSESGGVAAPPEAARQPPASTVSVKGQEKPSAKMQAEVTKTVITEGKQGAKAVKNELIQALEKAVQDAPFTTDDYFAGLHVKEAKALSETTRLTDRPVEGTIPLASWLEKTLTSKDKTPNRETARGQKFIAEALEKKKVSKVTIEIPGDGTFRVWNTKDALQTVLDRAKKLSTSVKTPERGPFKRRGGIQEPPSQIKTVADWDQAEAFHGLEKGDRIAEWSPALAELAKKVNPEHPETVTPADVQAFIQKRRAQKEQHPTPMPEDEPPTPPAPGPGMGGLRPPQAGGPGAAASGDAPASPPQARAAGAAVEQGPVENRPHGPVSTIGLALNRARIGITDFIKGASGQSMPKTTRMSREAGEAGVRYASSRIAARPLAQTFVAHALEGTGVDPVKFGAALTEDNLQSIRESFRQKATELRAEGKLDESDAATAQADRVATLIGAKGSPFKTQEELWEYLERPEVKKAIAQHIQLWQEVIDPQYREAANIDPDVELPSRGQLTGARVNLKAVLPDERAVAPVRTGAGYPSLTATFKKKSPFAIQAKGTGQTYDVNYGEIIANTFERQLEIANKNAFDRILVETGNAEIHRPGWQGTIKDQSVVGFPLKRGVRPITTKEGEIIPISMAANIYVPRSIAQEYRFASNVDPRFRLPVVTGINNFLNKMALAGLTDFSVHTSNLMTALFNRPASGKLLTDTLLSTTGRADIPVILAKVFAKAFKDNQAQIAELSKIGAMRGSETAGFGFTGRILKSIDRATRLVLDDTYKSLVKEGLIKDTETNRREYVNQVGQYNRRLQGPLTRLLRDTGIGPFVTAGKTFNSLGVKMLTLSPGAPGANIFAASVLRGNVLSKWVGATVLIGALNYLITGYMAGRPGTPLGNVDTGKNDKSGKQLSLPLLSLIGLGRGLRVSGLRGAIESKRLGLTDADAIDAASRDIINSWVAPGAGPPIKAGFIGASGYQPAINVPRASRVVPPGESQRIENLKEALKEANPVVISAIKLWQGKSVPEIMSSQLPRFSLVPGKPESMVQKYPEIVSKAQGSAFIDDLIHEARRLPDAEKRAFLTEQIKRLPKDQQAHAWNEARRRRVFRSNLKPADLPK